MRFFSFAAWILLATAASAVAANGAERASGDLFASRVRPILARHCFKCHGPDDKARKAGLRLDVRDLAVKPAKSGAIPIVPGKPDESELISRIFADDNGERMPPPAAKMPLSDSDKQLLKEWVIGGATYTQHWAFMPPRPQPPPKPARAGWAISPIDSFVQARLESEGIAPSEPADRAALLRRLSLDLIGLPPKLDELDQFLTDSSPTAYVKQVDRLLASPHYGERWARRWLDLARYADTNGYEKDRPRSIWPYRDWVIKALNADMPFDRFTLEQIAGDMLKDATQSERIATGFHRNTMLNEEGGIDPLEFRFHAMTDRVSTTATVWLGLTLGCAQCHTHKFDPIPHRDYYRFMALLNNADEPEMAVKSPGIERRRHELDEKIKAQVAALPNRFPVPDKADPYDRRPTDERRKAALASVFHEWVDHESNEAVRWTVLTPVKATANVPLLTVQKDASVLASGDQSKRDVYTLEFKTDLKRITAIRLEALPDERLPSGGPGRVYYEGPPGDFFLSEFTVTERGRAIKLGKATASGAKAAAASVAIDGDPQTGWSINGGQGRAHSAVFQLAEPLAEVQDLSIQLICERYYAAGLGRFRISATTDTRPVVARNTTAEIEQLLLIPESQRTSEQTAQLRQHFLMVTPELAKEREAIDRLRAEMPAYSTTLILHERPPDNPRPTFIHNRGEYLQPTERIEPGVLSILRNCRPARRRIGWRWHVGSRRRKTRCRVGLL